MRRTSILIVATLVLGVAGCSSSSPTSSVAESTTTSTTTIASTLKSGDLYVALGSSIASGFGISVQSTPCGRSSRSYPNLLAAKYKLKLVDVTCGAALTKNVVDTAQGDNPPQLTAVTADTKLITVTVGGNDIGYNGKALVCGDPANVCTASPTFDADLAGTSVALTAMIAKIKAAAPSATIVFITYPREVPADKNCPALSFTDEEAALVRNIGTKLQAVFDATAKNAGMVYVDPYVVPGDHTGCAPAADRWTAGYVAEDGFAFHPTALGHQVMADMIAKALGG